MRGWRSIKISSSLFALVIMLSLYNHCTGQLGSADGSKLKFKNNNTTATSSAPPPSPSPLPADSRTVSLNSFSTSVYAITRARCLTCHASLQRPFHAAPDMATAHDEVINNAKVNFTDPAQSRLVLKLQDGHNCWGNCNSNSSEMLAAVNVWKAALDEWQAEQDAINQDNDITPSSSPTSTTTPDVGPLNALSNAPGAQNNTIIVRPEQFSVFSPMVRVQQGSDAYLWVPNGNLNSARAANDSAAGVARAVVNIPSTGTYKFYGLVEAPNSADNSFYVIPKAGTTVTWRLETVTSNGFVWREVTNGADELEFSTSLNQGNATIEVRQREDGTKLAGMVISSDLNLDVSDLSLGQKVVLRFDLRPVTGQSATITMTMEEFDDYTYKVSDLRLDTPVALNIREIRFQVNGTYNPQHSTYSYLNQTFGPGVVSLSPSSMLVLKEQGPDADRFSLQFGAISVAP